LSCSLRLTEDDNGDGVVDAEEGALIVVFTKTGTAANLLTKYRPPCPVFVATPSERVLRQANAQFAQRPTLQARGFWASGFGCGVGLSLFVQKIVHSL
jgi:hypothetical protein